MKLCWENLDCLVLISKNGEDIDVLKYYSNPIELEDYRGIFDISEKPCKYCGEYYLRPEYGIQDFCDKECKTSFSKEKKRTKLENKVDKRKKENGGGAWLLGELNINYLSKPNTVSFDARANKVALCNKVRSDPEDNKILQARCCMCSEWFNPNKYEVERVKEGIDNNTSMPYFYCSTECKNKCPYFNKNITQLLRKPRYSETHKIPKKILYYYWKEEFDKENKMLMEKFYNKEERRIKKEKELLEKQKRTKKINKEMEEYLNSDDRIIEQKLRRMLGLAKQRAKNKGWDFNLTYIWLRTNLPDKCPKCNLPFSFDTSIKMNPLAPSLQRINPSKGYTEDNCIVTSWIYNCGLNVFTEKVLYTICKSYLNNNS